jgi:hypothetical protein
MPQFFFNPLLAFGVRFFFVAPVAEKMAQSLG